MPFRESATPPGDGAIRHPVVLRRFMAVHEAEFARTQLAGNEIEARVEDGMTAGVHPWLGSALGGVRLVVSQEDEHRAKEVLDAIAEESAALDEKRTDEEKLSDEADAIARRAVTAAVFGAAFLPVLAHVYSVYLVLGIDRERLSETGRRRVALAAVVDVAVFGVLAWLIAR